MTPIKYFVVVVLLCLSHVDLSFAQVKVKLEKIYGTTVHSTYFTEDLQHHLGIKRQPFFLNRYYQVVDFHDAYLTSIENNPIKICASLRTPRDRNDCTHVRIDCKWLNMDKKESQIVMDVDFISEEWIIPVNKRGRGKDKIKKLVRCKPYVTSRGKELFLFATAKIDLRAEEKCYVKYELKAKRTKRPLNYRNGKCESWPSKAEFENTLCGTYKDKHGLTHYIYLNGDDSLEKRGGE